MSGEKQAKKGFVLDELVWWKQWLIVFGGSGAAAGAICTPSRSLLGILLAAVVGAGSLLGLVSFFAIVEGWRVKGWRKDRRRNCEEGEK